MDDAKKKVTQIIEVFLCVYKRYEFLIVSLYYLQGEKPHGFETNKKPISRMG